MKSVTGLFGWIYDWDGTIVDTQIPYHATAESIALYEYGVDVRPKEISERFAGMSTRKVFATLAPKLDAQSIERLNQLKWEIIYELLERQPLKILPGMEELCEMHFNLGIPAAIASASPRSWIEKCLDKTPQLKKVFADRFVSVEQCARSKPAPDVFFAAEDLISGMGKYIVVGDGATDVRGGLAAAMDVFYLSAANREFEGNPRVTRFPDSKSLSGYIMHVMS